jgi:hypothetical protein
MTPPRIRITREKNKVHDTGAKKHFSAGWPNIFAALKENLGRSLERA